MISIMIVLLFLLLPQTLSSSPRYIITDIFINRIMPTWSLGMHFTISIILDMIWTSLCRPDPSGQQRSAIAEVYKTMTRLISPGLPRVNSRCSYLRADWCWNASSASLRCCNMFILSQVWSGATIPLWEWGKKDWMWAHPSTAPKQLAIRWVLRNYCILPPDWRYSEITTEY